MRLKMEPSGGNGKQPATTTSPAKPSVVAAGTPTPPPSQPISVPSSASPQNGSSTGTAANRVQNGAQKYQSPPPPSTTTTATTTTTTTRPKSSVPTSTVPQSVPVTSSASVSSTTGSSSVPSSAPPPSVASTSTGSGSSNWSQFRFATTLPLRILVLKDLVGAIIGRGGGTIRQITQETHARVDVHRKESSTSHENVIMIYGNPENCSQACRRILEVMQHEAKSLNRPDEIALKILASNNLIGRIIGKGGNTIKRIMQQTDTKITISSANLASQFQMERIITILGQLDNMCKAEVMISQKLRQCFEADCLQYQHSLIYSGFHSSIPPLMPPSAPTGPLGGFVPGVPASAAAAAAAAAAALHGHHPQQPMASMSGYPLATPPTCTNLPPSALVGRTPVLTGSSVSSPTSSAPGSGGGGAGGSGSVAAAGGATGSQTHSVPPTPTQGPPASAFYTPYNLAFMYPPHSPSSGAMGAPFGAAPVPSNASYMNFNPYLNPMLPSPENIRETVTIFIPNSVVGAIIGRGGSTIREMMSNSGAVIKVAQMSEEESQQQTAASSGEMSPGIKPLERRVTIYGNLYSQNQAQFFVFQKVYTELTNQMSGGLATGHCPYGDPSVLKVEMLVPTNQVRRIIGKGGSVITELQRTSGAIIKLSKDTSVGTSSSSSKSTPASTATATAESSQQSETSSSANGSNETEKAAAAGGLSNTGTAASNAEDMTAVNIIGDYYASINAQRQIRLIVYRSMSSASGGSSSSTGGGTATATAPTSSSSVPSSSSSSSTQPTVTETTTSQSQSTTTTTVVSTKTSSSKSSAATPSTTTGSSTTATTTTITKSTSSSSTSDSKTTTTTPTVTTATATTTTAAAATASSRTTNTASGQSSS